MLLLYYKNKMPEEIQVGKIDTNVLSIDVTKCDITYEILQKPIRFLIMIMIMKDIENPY